MRRLLVVAALGGAAVSAWPLVLNVTQISLPNIQDNWTIPAVVHELGTIPATFPSDELIASADVLWTGHIPCPADYTPASNPNVQVRITNLTPYNYPNVWYVADGETVISNFDELVGCVGFPWLAFKIDSVGVNTPLVFESMALDGVFQSGETWEFVLQNFANGWGGPPSAFGSAGLAFCSTGDAVSTGSILVPEPAWGFAGMALAGLAAVRILRRRS